MKDFWAGFVVGATFIGLGEYILLVYAGVL